MTPEGQIVERVVYDPYGRARQHHPTDYDGDGDATITDLFAFISARGSGHIQADWDRDGDVDVPDLFAYLAEYMPYLAPVVDAGRISWEYTPGGISPERPDNQIGYCGYVFNPETDDYTVRFRHYDPEIGRWLKRDPAGYVDGISLQEYVSSNPLLWLDPLGLEKVCGPTVWAITGSWCEEREIYEGAYESYVQTVWDRTNGTLDALSFGLIDLENLAGVDWTFDPTDRENARCVSGCILDSLVNTVIPMPPGLSIRVFKDGDGSRVEFSFDPRQCAPGTMQLIGGLLEKRYSGYYQWRVVEGRTGDFRGRTELGVNDQIKAKRLSQAGKAAALLKFLYDITVKCWDDCSKEKCDPATSSNGAATSAGGGGGEW